MAQYKKSDVTNFMDTKINKLITKEHEAIDAIAEEFKPTIEAHYTEGFADINRLSSNLYDKVLAYSDKHQLSSIGNFNTHLIGVNAVINWDKSLQNSYGVNIIKELLHGRYVSEQNKRALKRIPKFDEWFLGAIPRSNEHHARVKELKQLALEVKRVIRGATSGKNAYQDLIVLGVDMSEFKPTAIDHLPAVKQFSVDPCIINAGGCK
jgi:hypothetical protein